MTTDREPLVLSESEHAEMERLMAAAGIGSKRELVARAVALFGDVTAGRVPAPPPETETLTLADLLPPKPRWSWSRLWSWMKPAPPLQGRTLDEVLRDMRGEGGSHAPAAREGGTGGG